MKKYFLYSTSANIYNDKNINEELLSKVRYLDLEEVDNFLINNNINILALDKEMNSLLHLLFLDPSNNDTTKKLKRFELFKYLLNKNIPINTVNKYNQTILHLICINDDYECFKYLIEKYKNIDYLIKDSNKNIPLHYCLGKIKICNINYSKNLLVEINKENKNKFFNDDKENESFEKKINEVTLKKIFYDNDDYDYSDNNKKLIFYNIKWTLDANLFNNSPLTIKCQKYNVNIIKKIINNNPLCLIMKDNNNNTFLHNVVNNLNFKLFKIITNIPLIKKLKNENFKNKIIRIKNDRGFNLKELINHKQKLLNNNLKYENENEIFKKLIDNLTNKYVKKINNNLIDNTTNKYNLYNKTTDHITDFTKDYITKVLKIKVDVLKMDNINLEEKYNIINNKIITNIFLDKNKKNYDESVFTILKDLYKDKIIPEFNKILTNITIILNEKELLKDKDKLIFNDMTFMDNILKSFLKGNRNKHYIDYKQYNDIKEKIKKYNSMSIGNRGDQLDVIDNIVLRSYIRNNYNTTEEQIDKTNYPKQINNELFNNYYVSIIKSIANYKDNNTKYNNNNIDEIFLKDILNDLMKNIYMKIIHKTLNKTHDFEILNEYIFDEIKNIYKNAFLYFMSISNEVITNCINITKQIDNYFIYLYKIKMLKDEYNIFDNVKEI